MIPGLKIGVGTVAAILAFASIVDKGDGWNRNSQAMAAAFFSSVSVASFAWAIP